MSFKNKPLILLISILLSSASSFAQLDTTAITSSLNHFKSQLGKQYAFGLYKDGKIQYKKEAGEFNIKSQHDIEATSQWLTAALVMVLVQEGKIGLDDKISTYLPIYAKYGKAYITVRHCLTHYTGVDNAKTFQKSNFKNLEEEVDYFAVNREIKTNPGTEFYYSNVGFKIVARVLEIVAKKPFDRLMKEKLTSPLAMRNTSFANDNYDAAPDPANGAKSTTFDYLNFLSMLLNKGSFNGKQVLTEASVKTLLSLQAKVTEIKNAPKQAESFSYALGSWIAETNSKDEPTVFIAPGLNGTYAVLDLCRGYAFVLIAKGGSDIKKETCLEIKSTIDESLKSNCN
jgi:CubicO group peptidase (beta-lactamase class C family)